MNIEEPQTNNNKLYMSPLPNELIFTTMEKFVIPIDLEPNIFIDLNYLKTKLVPHFTQSLKTIKQSLSETASILKTAKDSPNSKKIIEDEINHYTYNFLNQDILRNLKTLSRKLDEITTTEIHHKITFLEQRVFILSNLKNICEYLIENPRFYFINLEFLNRKASSLVFELLPELYLEKNSLEKKIAILRSQIEFIQSPFSNKNENVDFTCHIISIALEMKDSNSKIVHYVPEFNIFRQFLLSTESPIQLHSFINLSPDAVDQEIQNNTMQLLKYGNFGSDDADIFEVVYYLLFSFFFEDYYDALEIEISKNRSEKVTQIIINSQNMKLNEIGFTSRYGIDSIKLNQTAKEYFETFKSNDLLITTQFLINPIDLLFVVQKIDSDLRSSFLSDNSELINSEEILSTAWKGLFIASAIPAIEVIFEKIEKWKNLLLMKSIYEQVGTIPRTVLQNWANE